MKLKLLNLCCGAVRPQSTERVEWVNVDNLHKDLFIGTPERTNLDKEANYINMDVEGNDFFDYSRRNPASFDGIVASHCVEHWDCQTAASIMSQCRMLLKPHGVLLVSVPDTSYFLNFRYEDTVENAERLFGEPIHLPDGETTFFGYALWNRYHKAILCKDSLAAYFLRAGFPMPGVVSREWLGALKKQEYSKDDTLGICMHSLCSILNRLPFSLVMHGIKA